MVNLLEFKSFVEAHSGPVRRDGRDWRGRCPACHDDGARGNLTFREGDGGRILVKCWSGCKTESILAGFALTAKDLFADNGNGKCRTPQRESRARREQPRTTYESIEAAGAAMAKRFRGRFTAHWPYHNADGTEAFVVLRFDACKASKGGKTYRPIHRDGAGYNEGDPPGPLPLYRLPELLARPTELVCVCEGEKAADAAVSIGLLTTTSAHGAKSADKTNWGPLAGRDIVNLPDNDADGEKYSEAVARMLLNLNPPAKVRVVRLPGLPIKGDLADYVSDSDLEDKAAIGQQVMALAAEVTPLAAPAPKEELGGTCTKPRAIQLRIVGMDQVTERETEWLWPGWIPLGTLTIIGGNPGGGKTSLALDLSTRLSRGWAMPGRGNETGQCGMIVFIGEEDGASRTLRPRLRKMGADLTQIKILEGLIIGEDEAAFTLDRGLQPLDILMELYPETKLLILDPITDYLGFEVNPNSNAEVRRVLRPLNPWADRHNVAVVGVTHLNKRKDDDAAFRVLGSMGFVAVARAVLGVSIHPEDADKPAWEKRRVVTPIKESYAPEGDAVVFRIDRMTQTLLWDAEALPMGANEALSGGTKGKPTGTTKAEAWLRTQLANSQGPVEFATLQKRAEECGVCSERTLYRAGEKIGVSKLTEGFGPDKVVWWATPGVDIAEWLQRKQ